MERGSSILDSCPDSRVGAWIRIGRRVKTTIVKVAAAPIEHLGCKYASLILEAKYLTLVLLLPVNAGWLLGLSSLVKRLLVAS